MNISKLIYTVFAVSFTLSVQAQKSDGTTKSLVNADKEFAASASKNGEKSAFLAVSAADALVFRPNPVNVKSFYAGKTENKNLSWTPSYARVAKSGDWGFTSGAFVEQSAEKEYGQYLSIWNTVNGKWVLKLDVGTTHNKPLKKVAPKFVEPKEFFKPKYNTEKQIAAGAEIIMTTEKTLNATIKSYGGAAFAGFVNPDSRLLFPGREPIIGKDNVVLFYNTMISKMNLKTIKAVKAASGDLAYTYGLATIDYKTDLRESFNYVFVYERQADFNWNLILQIYNPAVR